MEITIVLTDEQANALKARHNTEDLQASLQAYVVARAESFLKEELVKEIAKKTIPELKSLVPDKEVTFVEPVISKSL